RKDRLAAQVQEQRLEEVLKEKGAEARAYVDAVNRQRVFASEDVAAAIQTLHALALAAQPRPNDPHAAYKVEELRTILAAARQLALRTDMAGGIDPAAAQERTSLGELFVALGQPAEARRQFERAVAITRQAARAQPDNLMPQRTLAQAARGLGRLCLQEGQPVLAGNLAHEAQAAAEAWVRLQPNNVLAKQEEAIDLHLLADAAAARHDLPA